MDKVFKHSEICKELNNIYQAKNKDYGDSFGRTMKEYGLVMPAIRMEDKLTRYKQLIKRLDGPCVINESIEDTLLDLANYAIMTVIELRGEQDASIL
jgi:hypothetical protein